MCALETSASFHEEEDLALVRKAQCGDQSAFEELLKKKLSLIEKLALEFASSPLTFEDFYRIGKETLRKSIQMFDDRRGTRFGSFAYWGLKHAFQKATGKAKQKSSSSSSGFSVLGEALTSELEKSQHNTSPVQDVKSSQVHDGHSSISPNEDTNEEAMSFSLAEETPHVAHTRPISFVFLGKKYPVNSWIDFLVQIATLAYNGQHGDLLKEATPSEIAFTTRHSISSKPDGMIQPKRIADDLWIEGCFNAKQLVDFAKWITRWCNIEQEQIIIHFQKKGSVFPAVASIPDPISPTSSTSENNHKGGYAKEYNASSRDVLLSKRIDWSTLNYGLTLPAYNNEAFLEHLSFKPAKGIMYTVTLSFDDHDYSVGMIDIQFSNPSRGRTIQLGYTQHSPIAQALKIKFEPIYRQLEANHRNFTGINVFVSLSSTSVYDHFTLEFSETLARVTAQTNAFLEQDESKTSLSATQEVFIIDDLHIPQEFVLECSRILSDEFPRGMRRDSVIDRNKFCRKYESVFGKTIPEELKEMTWKTSAIQGVVIEDKVFSLKDEAVKLVENKLKTLLSSGIRQGYYAVIFEDGQNEYCEVGIGSAEVLAGVIRKLHPEFEYSEQFFRIDRSVSAEDEIVRVLENGESASIEELCAQLPGMPRERILQVCRTSARILSDGGKYVLEERLNFDPSETEEGIEEIRNSVRENGYALLREVHLKISETLNFDLTESALRQGFFQRFLSHDFKLKNGIISDMSEGLSVRDILLKYSQNRSSFTLTELNALYKDLTGDPHIHGDGLAVAHRTAFQVDDDHFVQPNQIEFDKEGIDDALASMLQRRMKPLLDISTFISFPAVSGYQWNHYLLASYLRLASERFGLLELTISNCCNALIVPKANTSKDYCQAVAEFLLQENVPLDFDMVGRYATQKGLLARARKETVSAILSEMQRMIGGR